MDRIDYISRENRSPNIEKESQFNFLIMASKRASTAQITSTMSGKMEKKWGMLEERKRERERR